MVSLVDSSPIKSLAFHFQSKIDLRSPQPACNSLLSSSFLTWSDERRRPQTPPCSNVKSNNVNNEKNTEEQPTLKATTKNDIRKYFPVIKRDNNMEKNKKKKTAGNSTYKPTSTRAKYSRYTEVIPPREQRVSIFSDDDTTSEEEDHSDSDGGNGRRRRRATTTRSRYCRNQRNDSKSRSRSPVFSTRRRRHQQRTPSRGIMFSADDLTNLVPPSKNQIKGLSKYRPIELQTFMSSYSTQSKVKELEQHLRLRSKTIQQSPSSTAVKSIFQMKQLSLV